MLEEINIIEKDSDIPEDNSFKEGSLYPYDPAFEDIDIKEDRMSVFQYVMEYKREQLIIDPDFQRNLVWGEKQKSQFIESIILNFPLPPFYLNENKKGKLTIIDGLQRTTTLFQFLNGDFALSELEALPKLNGETFFGLEPEFQTKIERKNISLYILKPSTPLVVIYDLFKRINTGGTQLNRQEIRNCIFIGKATKLLKDLAQKEYFKEAIDYGVSPKRMKDREVVLRYISFKIQTIQNYSGNMSNFLEDAMRKINNLEDSELEKITNDFERVMKYTFSFFGKDNFRLPTNQTRGTINIAVFESISIFFSNKSDEYLITNKLKIKDNYLRLLNNTEYIESVKSATSSKSHVKDRFEIVENILGDL